MNDRHANTHNGHNSAADTAAAAVLHPTTCTTPVSRGLRMRARTLRRDANIRLAPLAAALRRRAAELELQAYILDNRLQPIPVKSR